MWQRQDVIKQARIVACLIGSYLLGSTCATLLDLARPKAPIETPTSIVVGDPFGVPNDVGARASFDNVDRELE